MYVQHYSIVKYACTVNSRYSTATLSTECFICHYLPALMYSGYSLICHISFSKNMVDKQVWWINWIYSLVLVHYIGTGKLWQIKRFGG